MSNYQPMTKKTDIYCIKFVFTVDIVKINCKNSGYRNSTMRTFMLFLKGHF